MATGYSTLSAFSDARAKIEQSARRKAAQVHDIDGQTRKIIERQATLFRKLASIAIDADFALPDSVKGAMDRRERKIVETKADVTRIKDALSSLKRMREKAVEAMTVAETDLAAVRAEITEKFDADPKVVDVRARKTVHSEALGVLKGKKDRAEDERDDKRGAYEKDIFFAYLRARKFGEEGYSTWLPLFRLWDAQLARATDYLEEKANYDRLLGIPGWVDERIAALGPNGEAIEAEFKTLSERYFGVLGDRTKTVEKLRADVRGVDAEIGQQETAINAANRFLSDSALAEDADMKKIVTDFTEKLSRTGLADLDRLARSTAGTEDDEIVSELRGLAGDLQRLVASADEAKRELVDLEARASRLEEVESAIRRKGWNGSDHKFSNVDPEELAARIWRDAYTSSAIISMLTQAHRDPPQPPSYDYGSSRSSSSSSGSSWNTTKSSSDDNSYSTSGGFGGSSNDDNSYTPTGGF